MKLGRRSPLALLSLPVPAGLPPLQRRSAALQPSSPGGRLVFPVPRASGDLLSPWAAGAGAEPARCRGRFWWPRRGEMARGWPAGVLGGSAGDSGTAVSHPSRSWGLGWAAWSVGTNWAEGVCPSPRPRQRDVALAEPFELLEGVRGPGERRGCTALCPAPRPARGVQGYPRGSTGTTWGLSRGHQPLCRSHQALPHQPRSPRSKAERRNIC